MVAYMAFWYWSKTNVAAIFNNRPACTMQIDINILALMDSDLSGGNQNDAVLDLRDVSSSSNMSCNDQRVLDVVECQTSKRSSV